MVSLVKGKDIRLAHQILVPHGLSPRFMPANVIFLTRDHSWPAWPDLLSHLSFLVFFQKEKENQRKGGKDKDQAGHAPPQVNFY